MPYKTECPASDTLQAIDTVRPRAAAFVIGVLEAARDAADDHGNHALVAAYGQLALGLRVLVAWDDPRADDVLAYLETASAPALYHTVTYAKGQLGSAADLLTRGWAALGV